MPLFSNRTEAGRLLASRLRAYEGNQRLIVIALPRGGVPVGFELARNLHAPLDIMTVRKIGVPGQPELAMGAVASGGICVLNEDLIRSLNLSKYYVYAQIAKQRRELQKREMRFRRNGPAQSLSDRIVVLVDDGAATGATMLAAIQAVRTQSPKQIIVAVPVASAEACEKFETETGTCICLATPEPFLSVGQYYRSFPQVTDQEVEDLLLQLHVYRETAPPVLSASAANSQTN